LVWLVRVQHGQYHWSDRKLGSNRN